MWHIRVDRGTGHMRLINMHRSIRDKIKRYLIKADSSLYLSIYQLQNAWKSMDAAETGGDWTDMNSAFRVMAKLLSGPSVASTRGRMHRKICGAFRTKHRKVITATALTTLSRQTAYNWKHACRQNRVLWPYWRPDSDSFMLSSTEHYLSPGNTEALDQNFASLDGIWPNIGDNSSPERLPSWNYLECYMANGPCKFQVF